MEQQQNRAVGKRGDTQFRISVDIMVAVIEVRSALPRMRALRPLILESLPKFDVNQLDHLERYASDLADAHAAFVSVAMPTPERAALVAEGLDLRARLIANVRMLEQRDLIGREWLKKVQYRQGYRQLASDLLLLAALLRARWELIQGKCAISEEDIARAASIGERLTAVVWRRRTHVPNAVTAAAERQRAFGAFLRAYMEVRRAVQYLRFYEGDADRIAPPLSGRRKRSKGPHGNASISQVASAPMRASSNSRRSSAVDDSPQTEILDDSDDSEPPEAKEKVPIGHAAPEPFMN